MKNSSLFAALSTTAILILMACSPESNPYRDPEKAGATLTSPATDTSLQIFSSFDLDIDVVLPGLISRLRVHMPANRYWPAPDTVIDGNSITEGNIVLTASVADTGTRRLVISVITVEGDSTATEHLFNFTSPLSQGPVEATSGTRVVLRTPPVEDDVLYVWDFGGGFQLISPQPFDTLPMSLSLPDSARLFVRDGGASSPAVVFPVRILDRTPPVIECLNENLSADTVYTGEKSKVLRFAFTDDIGPIREPKINGSSFTEIDSISSRHVTASYLMKSIASVREAVVSVVDAAGMRKIDTFYVAFIEEPASQPPRIIVLSPASDSVTITDSIMEINGIIEGVGPTHGVGLTIVAVEHDTTIERGPLKGTLPSWKAAIPLRQGTNTIRIVTSPSDTTVEPDTAILVVFYGKEAEDTDTVNPTIANILVDGVTVESSLHTTEASSVEISVVTYDEGAGIASVRVNDSIARHKNARFEAEVPVFHVEGGTRVLITARDSAGNTATHSVYVLKNSTPAFTRLLQTNTVVSESLLVDTIRAEDPDNDPVTIQVRVRSATKDTTMRLDESGLFTWRPNSGDTAEPARILFSASDGYGTFDTSVSLFVVRGQSDRIDSVAFATTSNDFPDTLRVGRDTLEIVLSVVKEPSTKCLFNAVVEQSGQKLISDSYDSLLSWVPSDADTGTRHLIVSLGTAQGITDTIAAQIRVLRRVGPPAPPDSIAPTIASVLIDGAAVEQLHTTETTPVEISVVTFDNGVGIAAVQVNDGTARLEDGLFSAQVPVFHTEGGTKVLITARDSAGNTATHSVYVLKNSAPTFTRLLQTNTVVSESLLVDTIRAEDPDNDPVTIQARVRSTTQDTSMRLDGSGLFAWRPNPGDTAEPVGIVFTADDGYTTTDTSAFVIVEPSRSENVDSAAFVTTPNDFPDSLRVGRDTLTMVLSVAKGPSTRCLFNAVVVESGERLISDSYDSLLSWVPDDADTGTRRLVVSLTTSQEITDTVVAEIRVLPRLIPPAVFFAFDTVARYENVAACSLGIRLSHAWITDLPVGIAINAAQSTTDAADLTLDQSSITIPAGDTLARATVTVNDDNVVEPDERTVFELILSSPAVPASPQSMIFTILNDDSSITPTVSFVQERYSTPERDTTLPVPLRISPAAGETVTITVAASGSAEQGTDYALSESVVRFDPGDTTGTLSLSILDDNECERNAESIVLSISDPGEAEIGGLDRTTVEIGANDILACDIRVAVVVNEAVGGGRAAVDAALVDSLTDWGYDAEELDVSEADAAASGGYDMIFLSNSLDGEEVGSLKPEAVPIIAAGRTSPAALGMDASAELQQINTNTIQAFDSPLRVTAGRTLISWSTPSSAARIIATSVNDLTRVVMCDYAAESLLADLTVAAGRRVQFPMGWTPGFGETTYTREWWDLLRATVTAVASGSEIEEPVSQ